MAKSLPATPNLMHLKKQAKQLVHDHQAGEVEAFNRIKASFPKLMAASVHEIIAAEFSRCNAQLVVAREYGYATWKELVAAIEEPGTSWFKDTFIGEHPSLETFGAQPAAQLDKEAPHLSPESEEALKHYDWPGNVRELNTGCSARWRWRWGRRSARRNWRWNERRAVASHIEPVREPIWGGFLFRTGQWSSARSHSPRSDL
ncbi:MAG: hypothetical protein VX293_08505 [Candidatus Latescibacterota bacterium]|nr:hypothetical protein [Candidatus Latescibacterota bacterium]